MKRGMEERGLVWLFSSSLSILVLMSLRSDAKECLPGQTLVNSSCWWCLMKSHALYGDNLLARPLVIGSNEVGNGEKRMAWYECRKRCADTKQCAFWTFDRTHNTCYLKFGQGKFVFESDDYVSGTKHCKPYLASRNKDVFPVVRLTNEAGERVSVKAAPASFGPSFGSDVAEVRGMAFRFIEPDTFACGPDVDNATTPAPMTPPSTDASTEVAFVDRGGCAFVTKTLYLQSQGFKAAVVLDTQLVRSKLVPPIARITAPHDSGADRVAIPVAFIRTAEAVLIRRFLRRSKAVVVTIEDKGSWQEAQVESSESTSLGSLPSSSAAVLKSMTTWVVNTYSPLSVLLLFVLTTLAAVVSLTCLTYVLLSWRRIRNRRRTSNSGPRESEESVSRAVVIEESNKVENSPSSSALTAMATLSSCSYRDPREEAELLLECPVCLEPSWPPKRIFQCLKGHTLCEECVRHPQLKQCPVCRHDLSAKHLGRNLALEKLARALYNAKHSSTPMPSWSPSAPPLISEPAEPLTVFTVSSASDECDVANDVNVENVRESENALSTSSSSPALLTVHLPPSP